MRTDYKFWYIKRDDDGWITETAVRFYEGDYVAGEKGIKYQRDRKLDKTDLPYLADKFISDSASQPAVLYTQKDFGMIKTDDELRLFMNAELAKDGSRQSINEQINA